MSSKDSFGIRSRILEIHAEMLSIKKIHDSVVSEYVVGKRILSEARSNLRTNQKKCLSLLKKARNEFMRESVVATEYNKVREKLRFSTDSSMVELDKTYHKELVKGDYDAARKLVVKMSVGTTDLEHPISMKVIGIAGSRVSIEVANSSNRDVVVIHVRGINSGEKVVFDNTSFSLKSFSTFVITTDVVNPRSVLDVTLDYRDSVIERSISIPFRLE